MLDCITIKHTIGTEIIISEIAVILGIVAVTVSRLLFYYDD
jgi:hypothetical protein